MNIEEVIPKYSILDEIMDIFGGNFKAVCIAVEDLSTNCTITQIHKDLSQSKWQKHEEALIKCSELFANEVKAYIEYANIDYSECRRTLEATANYIRLNDFRLEATQAKNELDNLYKIRNMSDELIGLISKIAPREAKRKKKQLKDSDKYDTSIEMCRNCLNWKRVGDGFKTGKCSIDGEYYDEKFKCSKYD